MQPFIDYFALHPFLFWATCFSLSGILEVTLPSFTFIFVTLASLLSGLVSLRWGWPAQVITFGVALLVSVFVLRPFLISRKKLPPTVHSRVNALLGKSGKVTETLDGKSVGRVTVEGQDWAAKSQETIAVGKQIVVEGSDGIVLIVKKV